MALEPDGKWLLETLIRRDERYRLAMAYYAGDHRLRFATEKWRNAFGQAFRAFSDNLCAPVVDAYTDRLQVRGFDAQGGEESAGEVAGTVEQAVGALWRDNRMDVQSGQVHHDAVLCGDGYAIVWRPEQTDAGPVAPVIYPQSPRHCAVDYDEEVPGRKTFAGKVWRQRDGRVRLTLYYPDHVERYVTRTGRKDAGIPDSTRTFVAYDEDRAGGEFDNEWGVVPVFHFANAKGVGQAGVSVLEPVFSLNDALNKAVLDMLVSMEYVSYPQRWASGIDEELDPVTRAPTGQPAFKPGPERMWLLENPEAKIGQLDQADLTQHVAVQESIRTEITRVTGIPRHLLLGVVAGGDWPSGESLRNAEARLTKRSEDLMGLFGPEWSAAMMLALRMAAVPTPSVLETLWVPAETRQDRTQAETAVLKKTIGVSEAQLQRELGYTDDQRERIAAERAEEAERARADVAAGGLGLD